MLDLAVATGIQRGSLYNAYHGKETVFLLAFESYAARVLKAVRQAFADLDPRRALRAFFEVGIANMAKGHPPRGCLTTKTATEPEVADTPVQMRLRALLDEMEAIAAVMIAAVAAAAFQREPAKG
jgi:TetR/AcrR family transcriptional repressor of nem operon